MYPVVMEGRLGQSGEPLSGSAGAALRRAEGGSRAEEEKRVEDYERMLNKGNRVQEAFMREDSLRVSKRPGREAAMSDLTDGGGEKKKLEIAPRITSRHVLRLADEVYSVRWSPDGKYVAAGCNNGDIVVHSAATGAQWGRANTSEGEHTALGLNFLGESGKLLSANTAGNITVWQVVTGKALHRFKEDNDIFAMDLSMRVGMYATGGKDCIVRLYDVKTHQVVSELQPGEGKSAGHWNRIFSVRFHPDDPNICISGGWDNTVQIWDIREKSTVRSVLGPYMVSDSLDVSGDKIVSGSYRIDDQIQMWDMGTGKLLYEQPWSTGVGMSNIEPPMVYACRFSHGNGGQMIAAGGQGPNEVKVFRNDEQRTAARLGQATKITYSLEFSPTNEMIAVGTSAPALHIVDLSLMYQKNQGLDIYEGGAVVDMEDGPKLYQTNIPQGSAKNKDPYAEDPYAD